MKTIFFLFVACLIISFTQAQHAVSPEKAAALQQILNKTVNQKTCFGTVYSIHYKDQIWTGSAGNLQVTDHFFIASTTKLFVTALIMKYASQRLLNLDDPIVAYFPKIITNQLHVLNGVDYTDQITIRHLLSHTSGLPDYFEDASAQQTSLISELKMGHDRTWSFESCIAMSKQIKPLFKPGEKKKAHYADTNFQLLGKIIERISGKSFAETVKELITTPLGMTQTYLYADTSDHNVKEMYFKNHELHIPQAMTSFGPDGGMVSTVSDLMLFTKAFFKGQIFPDTMLNSMQVWNAIFFPLDAGIGLHRFKMMRAFDPFGAVPILIGHSGLSGTLAYYSPKDDLFICGTVNQIAYESQSFQTGIKLVLRMKK